MSDHETTTCPSALRLDAYHAGELDQGASDRMAAHVATCPACQAELKLRAQGFAAFGGTEHAQLARFRERMDTHMRTRSSSKADKPNELISHGSWRIAWRWLTKPGVLAVAATAIFAVLMLPRDRPNAIDNDAGPSSARGGRTQPAAASVRAKGGLGLEVFVARGHGVESVNDNETLQEGDRLRFRISLSNANHVMLVGQEQSRKLYPIAPLVEGQALFMPAGPRQLLPQTIELDGSRGQERFHLIVCAETFEFKDLAVGRDSLKLPSNCAKTSVRFTKTPARDPQR